jgi:hypothetical protein
MDTPKRRVKQDTDVANGGPGRATDLVVRHRG